VSYPIPNNHATVEHLELLFASSGRELSGTQPGTAAQDQSAPMSDEPKAPLSANQLLKNSSLYREFLQEREEILKHKWIESEKAGRDIGFEWALTDWIIKHRPKWRENRRASTPHGHV
jgi:hypothetical protein